MRKCFIIISLLIFSLVDSETYGCFILFHCDGNNVIVGNHEDWFATNAAVRIIPAGPGTYRSVIFTFTDEGWAQGGMNEKGLFFDAARTPLMNLGNQEDLQAHQGYLWQTVLDKCATVEDALKLISQYHIQDLEESAVMLADAGGNAVIIGVQNNKMAIKRLSDHHLLQTNFNQWHPELSDEPRCWRFEKATEILRHTGQATVVNMLNILKQTHQDSLTVYSSIYDLKNKVIHIYNKRHFSNPIELKFSEIATSVDCMVALDELEMHHDAFTKCNSSNTIKVVNGRIIDAETNEPVPYANIGIPMKNAGTLSDPDGTFHLDLLSQYIRDSITISSIGYKTLTLPISALSRGENIIRLQEESIMLKEITLADKRIKTKQKRLGWMGGKDGVLPFDTIQGGGAVALLVESPASPVFVEKLQVRLMYNSKDTLRFRFHIYSYDSLNHVPGEELLRQEIMLTETKRFGWLRFDLGNYNIIINHKKFCIGFEWIDDRKTRSEMLKSLKEWERWKKTEYENGNANVQYITAENGQRGDYKYHGNMMNWPGFKNLPPFTGLMIETGKHNETLALKTFERKTSFGEWKEIESTLNAVMTVSY